VGRSLAADAFASLNQWWFLVSFKFDGGFVAYIHIGCTENAHIRIRTTGVLLTGGAVTIPPEKRRAFDLQLNRVTSATDRFVRLLYYTSTPHVSTPATAVKAQTLPLLLSPIDFVEIFSDRLLRYIFNVAMTRQVITIEHR
jgi:predicted helicase